MMKKIKKQEKKIHKLNENGTIIKYYLNKNINGKKLILSEIASLTGYRKSLVDYYTVWKDVLYIKERSKLPEKYIKKIICLARNKKTSEMSGGRIAEIINELLKKDGVLNKNEKPQNLKSIFKKKISTKENKKSFLFIESTKKKE